MRTYIAAALMLLCSLGIADEHGAVDAFKKARTTEPQLIAFLKEMPKGGDLHNHVSGALFSDFLLDAQVAQGRHFDPDSLTFTDETSKPSASDLLTDDALRYRWLNAISMRGWTGLAESGHDHFFDTFRYIDSAKAGMSSAQILQRVVGRAMSQNIHYLELMTGTNSDAGYDAYFTTNPDSRNLSEALESIRPRLEALLADAHTFLDARDAELSTRLGLYGSVADARSPITLRNIWSCNRLSSNDAFFLQAAGGMYLAAHEPRVVAVNIVAPEDAPNARRNFDRQMEILDFLWRQFGHPNVTLHAGELTLPISPVETMRDRIWKSIQLGHARRIGHGVSIAWSDRVDDLLKMMHDQGIAVEICLTSNHSILGVDGSRHPLNLYRTHGVATFLNTDDEGVSRSNLTNEEVRGVQDQHLGYRDLKEMARNSIEYSFLSGKSLYEGRDYRRLDGTFKGLRDRSWEPTVAAKREMDANDKLAVEVRLERSFVRFESRYP